MRKLRVGAEALRYDQGVGLDKPKLNKYLESWQKILIAPDNGVLFVFNAVVGFFGLVTLVYDTYYAFLGEEEFKYSIFLLPIFLIDMVLKGITMYIKNLQLVDHPLKVLSKYMFGSFLIDLIANPPYYLLYQHLLWLKLF